MSGKYKTVEMLKWSVSRVITKLTTEGCQSYGVTMETWRVHLSKAIECPGARMDLNVTWGIRVQAGG